MNTRKLLATTLSLAALSVISFAGPRPAVAQAPAPADARPAPLPDPIDAGIAAAAPTDAEKSQIDAIVKKAQDARDAIIPPPSAGDDAPRSFPTQDQRDQIAAVETKEVADVKAVLTADQQAKFQTAYDAAKTARAIAPALNLLNQKLTLTADEKAKITPLIISYNEDATKIQQDQSIEQDDKRQKLTDLWTATRAKIRPLLTADQQTILDTITSLRRQRRRPAADAAPAGDAPAAQH